MTRLDIAHRRLHNQCIAQHPFAGPEEVVSWFGAVQAQDFAAAKWALGLRLPAASDESIERAFNAGAILRTHVMRPTWHFVAAADIRWLLMLTAPRVHAINAGWYRKLELDDATCRRHNALLVKALQFGHQLTRAELAAELEQEGVVLDHPQRATYIVMRAELDGIICSGARRGKQFTYALLAERAPQARQLDRGEALAELTRRYFTSHGPATLHDFAWWSGLTLADARTGVASVQSQLVREVIEEQEYWCTPSTPPVQEACQATYLLPNFDEYTVGYTDRSAVLDPVHADKLDWRSNTLNNVIVLNGEVVGYWRRVIEKNSVLFTPTFFLPLNENDTQAFNNTLERYCTFLGKPSLYNIDIAANM